MNDNGAPSVKVSLVDEAYRDIQREFDAGKLRLEDLTTEYCQDRLVAKFVELRDQGKL